MPTTIVLQQAGPLPVSAKFQVQLSQNPAVLVVYGSGFAEKANVEIGCEIFLNGSDTTQAATVFSNGVNTHRQFLPRALLVEDETAAASAPATFSIELQPYGTDTITDLNDSFLVLLHH